MWIIKDDLGYDLPLAHLSAAPISPGLKSEQRAFSHGGIATGTAKMPARKVEVECFVEAATESDYFRLTEELKRYAMLENFRLYLTDNRYFKINGLTKYEESFVKGFYMRRATIKLDFLATDPFYYSGKQIRATHTGSDNQIVEVMNYCNCEVPLIASIQPLTAAVAISVRNQTANSVFNYADPDFTSAQQLIVNAEDGTVSVGGENRIYNFNGAFPVLKPGLNRFKFNGAGCSLEFIYHERYI